MSSVSKEFLVDSDRKSFDKEHRRKLLWNIGKYDAKVIAGKHQYADLELAKLRASAIKTKVIHNLDKHLIEFEAAFTKRGGKVIWANDAQEAIDACVEIAHEFNVKSAVKSKSMITEEIHFNELMPKHGVRPVETDLGEVIQQLDGETPYHIVTPAMHKSKADVAKLFHEKEGMPPDSTPEEITMHVRKALRKDYSEAEMGVSGCNFLVADIGGVCLTENEGNAIMAIAYPKVHIAIVGIERTVPTMADLDLFWPLLATYGTGQNVTVYNSVTLGPRQSEEYDGPQDMYVILLDNGRTNLMAQPEQRQALNCIRCGACLNACPIYQSVGGHTYGTTYTGPIGSVITPHMRGMEKFKHLSFASSLCGRCTEVCPVKIDLHEHLLRNRRDSVDQKLTTQRERLSMYFFKTAVMSRKTMERGGAGLKNFFISAFFKGAWGDRRDLPKMAPKSFNKQWQDRYKTKS
jgi:L-lactate dehydrogenase complex protein LldF